MQNYLQLMGDIIQNGADKDDRTGTGTYSLFGRQLRFDLREGFPVLTTKKLHLRSIIHELLWFLQGDTHIKYLNDNNVHIWDEWRRPYGLDREVVEVPKRRAVESAPYTGSFWPTLEGLTAIEVKLLHTWRGMMRRCYDPKHHQYRFYGGRGVTVHPSWHDPQEFFVAVKRLPHWFYKQQQWDSFELDKDYYGAEQYGPDTAVWLHTAENDFYTKSAFPVEVVTPEDEVFTYITLNEASRQLGVPSSSVSRFVQRSGRLQGLKGRNRLYVGYEFRPSYRPLRLALIEDGELGPIYGRQWRSWPDSHGGIDQIQGVLNSIKNNPDSRRHIVSAWNVAEIDAMALPPCHCLFQFWVHDGGLSCQLYQRSADYFLGVPFNIASYALLTMMVAKECGLEAREFIHTFGDVHIYKNHLKQCMEQLQRDPRPLPIMLINPAVDSIFAYQYEDFQLLDYDPWPTIKAPIAV